MTETLARAVPLLERDVAATVGPGYANLIVECAANVTDYGTGADEKLVEQVQEAMHDLYVDTSWPACPRHGRHPLWYRADGWWWCERDQVAVCRLGQLPATDGGA